jgi:hypothetical protein
VDVLMLAAAGVLAFSGCHYFTSIWIVMMMMIFSVSVQSLNNMACSRERRRRKIQQPSTDSIIIYQTLLRSQSILANIQAIR